MFVYKKVKVGLRWVEVHLNTPQPISTHFNPLCSFYFCLYVHVKQNTKKLKWVEVDLNPLQPSSIHFVVSTFVFILMSSEIQKNKSGSRWVEVDLNPLCIFYFCFYVHVKSNTKKGKWVEVG